MDQRRDLPVALRAFVRRNSRLDGGGTLLGTIGLAAAAVGLSRIYGGEYGWVTLLAGATLAPLGFMVNAARRLLRQGFSFGDVAPAYQREREQSSEELSVEYRQGAPLVEKVLKYASIGGMTSFGVGVTSLAVLSSQHLGFAAERPFLNVIIPLIAWGGGIGFLSTLGYLALLQRRTDVDTGFWARVWRGPLGRLAFSIARRSGVSRTATTAMTHRATELSLGLAAEQLFETLPKETQKALGDLPAVLTRLQKDAQALRARYESLQEALSGKVAADPEYDDLRTMRDEMHARLGEAVGSLETMRLGLLRLHAGSQTVEGLTTHLGIAAEVSAQVSRLVSAHQDVERALRFPAQPAATPV
jgi:hypothetical protein